MDKVKAVLKHGFWILFVLLLPVVMYGYHSAKSELMPKVAERSTKLETDAKDAEKNYSGTPNEKYEVGLKVRADAIAEDNLRARRNLWVTQLTDMTWPARVAKEMPEGYRAFEDEELFTKYDNFITLRREYAKGYERQLDALFEYFEPYVGQSVVEDEVTWPEKVLFDRSILPRDRLITNKSSPTTVEIWDAQEDIWLARVLADVIREMNANATTINDAVIRKVERLDLFGATGNPDDTGSMMNAMMGMPAGGFEDPYENLGSGARSVQAKQTNIDFQYNEEFGPSVSPDAAAASTESMPGLPGGVTGRVAMLRYIGDADDGATFKERGFYMSLLLEQDRVPDFLTELTSARWPIRIVRFQMGRNPYFQEGAPAGPSSTLPPGSGFNGAAGGQFAGPGDLPPNFGGGFGGGGFGGPTDAFGGGGGFGGGGFGGGGGNTFGGSFGVQSAVAAVSDPVASSAISGPNLVKLTITGAITIYTEPDSSILGEEVIYPVPVEGKPYQMPTPTPTPESEPNDSVAMTKTETEIVGTN